MQMESHPLLFFRSDLEKPLSEQNKNRGVKKVSKLVKVGKTNSTFSLTFSA
jgi:hypothetical protein